MVRKNHVSSHIQYFEFPVGKLGCIGCILMQVYNKYNYHSKAYVLNQMEKCITIQRDENY